MTHPNGLFTWSDVALPDPKAGAEFYGALFGWKAEQGSPEESMPYWMLTKDGKTVAGMGGLSEEQQGQGISPMWSSYINVTDIDATVALAKEAGADVVMEPMQIFDSGKMAYLIDPAGAAVGLWQAGTHAGADEFNTTGFMCWNELATRDVAGAIAFYTKVFGWTADTQEMGDGSYTTFKVGDRPNGGAYDASRMLPEGVPANWSVYFTVDDCDAAVAKIKELGGALNMGPFDTPVGRTAAVADPQGANFIVIEMGEHA